MMLIIAPPPTPEDMTLRIVMHELWGWVSIDLVTNCCKYLFSQGLETADEPGPVVPEEWSVNPLQALLGARIHTHIQLRHRN